jgi:hypothetical protein
VYRFVVAVSHAGRAAKKKGEEKEAAFADLFAGGNNGNGDQQTKSRHGKGAGDPRTG